MDNQTTYNPPPPPEETYGQQLRNTQRLPRQKTRTVPMVIAGLTGLVIGSAATLGMVAIRVGFDQDPTSSQAASDPSSGAGSSDETEITPRTGPSSPDTTPAAIDDEPASFKPAIDDFKIETSVKEQRCFGTAGCNVTIRTEPAYVGDGIILGNWEVTYEITGIEDGPVIRTFEIMDDQVSFEAEARVQVPSESFDIKTEITEIREGLNQR